MAINIEGHDDYCHANSLLRSARGPYPLLAEPVNDRRLGTTLTAGLLCDFSIGAVGCRRSTRRAWLYAAPAAGMMIWGVWGVISISGCRLREAIFRPFRRFGRSRRLRLGRRSEYSC